MKKVSHVFGITVLSVLFLLGLWFIASQIPYDNPLGNSTVQKKNVVVGFIDKTPMYGLRIYLQDEGIFTVNARDVPEFQRGDTVDVTIYQHQIVKIEK